MQFFRICVDSQIEFRKIRGFSAKCRGYLEVIWRFVENRVAVKRKTRARTTTETKHDPIHNSLPLLGDYIAPHGNRTRVSRFESGREGADTTMTGARSDGVFLVVRREGQDEGKCRGRGSQRRFHKARPKWVVVVVVVVIVGRRRRLLVGRIVR